MCVNVLNVMKPTDKLMFFYRLQSNKILIKTRRTSHASEDSKNPRKQQIKRKLKLIT